MDYAAQGCSWGGGVEGAHLCQRAVHGRKWLREEAGQRVRHAVGHEQLWGAAKQGGKAAADMAHCTTGVGHQHELAGIGAGSGWWRQPAWQAHCGGLGPRVPDCEHVELEAAQA